MRALFFIAVALLLVTFPACEDRTIRPPFDAGNTEAEHDAPPRPALFVVGGTDGTLRCEASVPSGVVARWIEVKADGLEGAVLARAEPPRPLIFDLKAPVPERLLTRIELVSGEILERVSEL